MFFFKVRRIFYGSTDIIQPRHSMDKPNIAYINWLQIEGRPDAPMDFLFYFCVLSLIYVAEVNMILFMSAHLIYVAEIAMLLNMCVSFSRCS